MPPAEMDMPADEISGDISRDAPPPAAARRRPRRAAFGEFLGTFDYPISRRAERQSLSLAGGVDRGGSGHARSVFPLAGVGAIRAKQDKIENFKAIAVPVGLAMLVAPFILFAAPAGFFADRFSKRTVIVGCKVAEVILMLLGVAVIYYGNVWAMFFILFLMGTPQRDFRTVEIRLDSRDRPHRLPIGRQRIDRHDDDCGHRAGIARRGLFVRLDAIGRPAAGHSSLVALGPSTIVGVALIGFCTSLPIRQLENRQSAADLPAGISPAKRSAISAN